MAADQAIEDITGQLRSGRKLERDRGLESLKRVIEAEGDHFS